MHPDNIGQQFAPLFHGTDADLPTNGMVLPGDKVGAASAGTPMDEAWATENLEDAKHYGKNVYEVAHVHPPSEDTPNWWRKENTGNNVYSSKVGFKILRKVEQ